MMKDDIIGVYRQQSHETVAPDGTVTVGEPRTSQMIYGRDGHMSVLSTPGGRKSVAGTGPQIDLDAATPETRAEAARGIVAFAGRFEVRGDEVRHMVEIALNPNLVGHTLVRQARLEGDDLILSTEPDAQGACRRIRWRRVGKS